MKKLFFVAAIACLALVSCDKDEKKCWKITYETTVGNLAVEHESYQWLSANEVDAMYGKYDGFTKKSVRESETDCALKNVGLTTDK